MTYVCDFARLGEKPKLKHVPVKQVDPRPVAEFVLHLLNYRKRAENDLEDRSVRVEASVWGELAEIVAKQFHQGDKVFTVGDLYASHWTDSDGKPRSKYKLDIELIFPDTKRLEGFRYKPRTRNERSAADLENDDALMESGMAS